MRNRAPKGLLTVPGKSSDLMKNVEKIFNLWYQVWNDAYLPMAAEYKKWPSKQDNLQVGDIVLFKIKDSCFASVWKIGKIDEVHEGRDGLVRGVDVSYKLVEPGKDNARHMVIQRPVKQIVKLFHISDTSLINDIAKVKKITETITKRRNKVKTDDDSLDMPEVPDSKPNEVSPHDEEYEYSKPMVKIKLEEERMKTGTKEDSEIETESQNDDEETTSNEIPLDKDKKKRKTEIEKLLIENDKFWREFDERKKRLLADVSCSILYSEKQEEMFLTDSTSFSLNYGVGLGLEEGIVSLL